MSQSGPLSFNSSGASVVELLTGNSGGSVGPDASHNINTLGTGSITIVGNPGTHTLTTELTGLTNHSLLVGAGTPTITSLGVAGNGVLPIGSAGADPVLATLTAGSGIAITNGAGSITIAAGSSVPLTFDGDAGSATPAANVITISGGATGLTTSAAGSTVSLTGTLNLASGGTSASLVASNGGIFYSTGSAGAILPGTATARQMLQSGASTTPAWSTAIWPATTTINQILYSSSANVVAGLATANQGVLTTGATGIPVITALATNGQLIIGSTAGVPAAATLSAGTGISITNGSNSITIAASGTSNFTVTTVNHAASPYTVLSTDDFLAVNTSGGVVTINLPNAPATGKVYYIKDSNGTAVASNISVTTVGGVVTIDGQTTYSMKTNYQAISIIFDGSNYEVF